MGSGPVFGLREQRRRPAARQASRRGSPRFCSMPAQSVGQENRFGMGGREVCAPFWSQFGVLHKKNAVFSLRATASNGNLPPSR